MAKKAQKDFDAERAARAEEIAKALASIGDSGSTTPPPPPKDIDIKSGKVEHKQGKTDVRHRGLLRSAAMRRIKALRKGKKRKRGRRIKVS